MASTTGSQIVMFDFDGVIVDSLEQFSACMIDAFVRAGRSDLASREQVLDFLDVNWYEALAEVGVTPAQRHAIGEALRGRSNWELRPFPGMGAALAKLAERHTLVVITSSWSDATRDFLTAHGLAGIDEVLGCDVDESKVRKIARVMAEHGRGAHYWYVGDTVGDIIEGREAGVHTIGVAWGWHGEARLRRAQPDHIASTPEELVELIDG